MNNLKTIIKVDNLSKHAATGRYIIKDLNLEVLPGELIGLLGHSGCGKSTLMNIVCGIDSNYTGKIYIRDVYANKMGIYERNIRFLDNHTVLFDYLNVYDNIKLGFRDDTRISIEQKHNKINVLISKLGLEPIIDFMPKLLSHGQQQKVKFARAIVDDPDIVMLDEPFDGLDEFNSENIYRVIEDMNKSLNTTFIISSHDTYEVLDLTKRLIIMREGEIIVDQSKDSLLSKHNKHSWDYFNIGSVLRGQIVFYSAQEIKIKFYSHTFSLDLPSYVDRLNGKVGLNKTVLMYIDPRSKVDGINGLKSQLIRTIDFIFYYQNIFKHGDEIIQVNTIDMLSIGKYYYLNLKFILIEVIE